MGADGRPALQHGVGDAEMALRLGDLDEAVARFEALEAERLNDRLRARCLAGRAQVAFARGDHAVAIELFEEARSVRSDVAEDPRVADTLGRAHAATGGYDRALELFGACLSAAKETGDAIEALRFQVLIAGTLIDRGDFDLAGEILGEAVAIAKETADPLVRARLWWSQSRLRAQQNDPEAAATYARLALDSLVLAEHAGYAARAHRLLAHVELDRGDAVAASRLLAAAEPLIEANGTRFESAVFKLEQARVLAALGEAEAAAAILPEVAPALPGAGPSGGGRAYALLAEVHEALGDDARAVEAYERAVGTLPAGDRYLFEVCGRLARVLRRQGRPDEAASVLARAVERQGIGSAARLSS